MRAGLKGFGVRGSGFGVLVLVPVLVLSSVGAKASAGQDGTLGDMLAQVANRVREFYSRAQSIVCTEKVSVQIIGRNLMPDGFARVLEYELRVEWDATPESDELPEARVLRALRRVNGRAAREKDEPGCLDPKSGAIEPLAFLLPHHREEYTFAWNGIERLKDRRALTLDYKARRPGPIEGKWKGDCVSIDAPGRTKGRIWVDETTNDVLRLDESLTSQFEYRIPREHWVVNGPQTWTVERADSSIRYKNVTFHDPEEVVLLPESIQSLTIFRGAQSYRINQTFSDYRRFLTGGRIVK
ncbi:MAG TPA: hypothetical protein VKE51_40890 [Vicinamibacterales bacterium]|nr:hypothetical protein [Vicinamibacterales bacterium]